MKATTIITLPTGVIMGSSVLPYGVHEADSATGQAAVKITDLKKTRNNEIEVTVEIDVELVATFMGDRGRGNPSVLVGIKQAPTGE